MRITDHVYVLSGSYFSAGGLANVYGEVYGIDAPEGLILIDSGFTKDAFDVINENIEYYRLPKKPACVILTHVHFDHAGNALAFQESGAKIVAGAEDVYQCVNGGSAGLDLPSPFDDTHIFPAFTPDIEISCDCTKKICGVEINFIKIPGHTPGSIAPMIDIDGKKIVFTGDAIQPSGDVLLDSVTLGWQGDVRFSREAVVKSMMHLLKEAPNTDIVLPGHGKVCLKNGGGVIRMAAQTAFMTMR